MKLNFLSIRFPTTLDSVHFRLENLSKIKQIAIYLLMLAGVDRAVKRICRRYPPSIIEKNN